MKDPGKNARGSGKVTLEHLALTVQNGFTETNGLIDDLRKEIGTRLEETEKRFDRNLSQLIGICSWDIFDTTYPLGHCEDILAQI